MNILRMAPTVRTLQSKIGYEFRNAQYLWEAVQAPGSIIRDGEVTGAGTERHSIGFQRFPDGNRRLAILGDAVLRVVIVDDWYKGTAVRGMATQFFNIERKRLLTGNQRGSTVSPLIWAQTPISTW